MKSICRAEIEKAYAEGLEAVITLIEGFVKEFSERIIELENQKAKNSKNSHKPPSGDGFGKQTKSLRKKSEKKTGGQEGHEGENLKWEETVDQLIQHTVTTCRVCGEDLREIEGENIGKRQVHDLPEIKLEVIEHQIEKKICPHCNLATVSEFPETVKDWVQYGGTVRGLVTYLNQYQLIPSQRTQEIMRDVFDCKMSEGTIYNQVQKCYKALEPIEASIKETIQTSEVAHFDESGMRVNSSSQWVHVASTKTHTHYQVHEKRGQIAMDEIGILPNFEGKAVHDGFKSYNQYECEHYLCNAHHLRELVFIHEQLHQSWAEKMIKLLCKGNEIVKQAKLDSKSTLDALEISKFELEFQTIIDSGYKANPEPEIDPNLPKRKGRPKRSKALNLILRLDLQRKQVLGFIYDFVVPFDNNLAERDIRMVKLKQKISGCCRSVNGANIFARIRGYISTLKKQGLDILDALINIFLGKPLFV